MIIKTIVDANPSYSSVLENSEAWKTYFHLQAFACLAPDEFTGYLHQNGAIDINKVIPCRVFICDDDATVRYVFYNHSFIHIPKTAGRHMIYRYNNFQVGGNHLSANSNMINFHPYCLEFDSCYTVVRNPFSWLLSLYSHVSNDIECGYANCRLVEENKTFESFIYNVCELETCEQWFPFPHGETSQIFDKDGMLCTKNILFFERFETGVKELGLEERSANLIDEKEKIENKEFLEFKSPTAEYRNFYTSDMIDAVNRRFAFDLKFLGYDFNGILHDHKILSFESSVCRS